MVNLICLQEGNKGLTKVERGGVSGSGRPSDGNWARRVDLSSRLVELQGRDEGEGEEECAARVKLISPLSSMRRANWRGFLACIPELVKHGER